MDALLKVLDKGPEEYTIPSNLESHALSNWIMKDTAAGSCVDGRRASVSTLPIETDEVTLHFSRTTLRMEILQNIRLDLQNLKKKWCLSEELINVGVLRKTNSGLQYFPTKDHIDFITKITVPKHFKPQENSTKSRKNADWVYHDKIQKNGRKIGQMGQF